MEPNKPHDRGYDPKMDRKKAEYLLLGVILVLSGGAFITVMMYLATDDLVKAFGIAAIAVPLFWGLTTAALRPCNNWLRQLAQQLSQLLSDLWGLVKGLFSRHRNP
jgi:hypothetical protein